VRSLPFSPYLLRLFSFCLNNMFSLSMGEGVVLYFLVLVFVCILGFGESGLD